MRILLVAPQPFYEDRGTPIAIYQTLIALNKLGFKVDIATYPVGSEVNLPDIKIFRAANPFKYRNVPIGFSFPKVVLDISLFATVLRLLFRNQYDCIHGVEEGAAVALICKRLFGIPVIYDMQSSLPEQLREMKCFNSGHWRWLSLSLERWLVRNADCIIASRGLSPYVLSIEPGKAVFEIFFKGSVNCQKNEELAKSLKVFGHPTIVYAGNFAFYQGLEVLLEATVIVRAEMPEVMLILVGATETEFVHYSKMVKKLKLEDTVKLYLRRPKHEIPEFLSLADVLVLARPRGKNVPLKMYEYLQSGKPIVATDIPAHRAILTEKIAIMAEPNARGLSRAIIHVLRNPGYANKIALAANDSTQTNPLKPVHVTLAETYQIIAATLPKQPIHQETSR